MAFDYASPAAKDYNLEVLQGNVPGHAMVSVDGHDSALSTTRITITPSLASGNIDQSSIDATPATVQVASTDANDTSAGTGLRTMRLTGLDGSGNAQTETVTMNGQTAVVSANVYAAVSGWRALTVGSGTNNAGVIWVGNGSFTAGVPATKFFSGDVEFNKGHTAYFVVPTGKTLYLRSFSATIASSTKDVEFFIETSTDGLVWITESVFGLESGAVFPAASLIATPGLVAGTHLRIEALSSAMNTIVSAIIGAELVDN